MTKDIILERAHAGLCPICKKQIDDPRSFVEVKHNGETILVCMKHKIMARSLSHASPGVGLN